MKFRILPALVLAVLCVFSSLFAAPVRAEETFPPDLEEEEISLDGEDLLLVPQTVFAYRRHSSSASSLELLDGSRFEGERRFFRHAVQLAGPRGWKRTVRGARMHLTSRLHALVLLPATLRRGDLRTAVLVLRHAFGS